MQNKPFLGAQIVQIPFFYFLNKKYPDHKIIGISPNGSAGILEQLGYLSKIYYYPPKKNLKNLLQIFSQFKNEKIEIAFNHRRHSLRISLYSRILTEAPIVGFKKDFSSRLLLNKEYQFDQKRYIAKNYLGLLEKSLEEFSSLFPRENGGYLLIIPAGSQDFKKYPIEKYIQLAYHLKAHFPVHFLLGRDMRDEIKILRKLENDFVLHIDKKMIDVKNIVTKARLVLANDCGPSHFAHIYDIPRISLFFNESTSYEWFSPKKNSILMVPKNSKNISDIEVDEIYKKALELHERTS